jgi:tRNA pseudouridine55 synthase
VGEHAEDAAPAHEDARSPHGVLVVDKPAGMTSHDVVARARRALRTRTVGHAGTLDPAATGVLVVAVGEATKLVPWLTAADKTYTATIRLGVATDSLDADGAIVASETPPALDRETVRRAADAFLGPHRQQAPAVSAIKVDGVRLHARARRGEVVEPPFRDVELISVAIESVEGPDIHLSLRCGKGFYVRSFARDLAASLGTLGHLTALRRTASGRFELSDACRLDEVARARLLPLVEATARVLPTVAIEESQATDARCGRRLRGLPEGELAILESGRLVAIVRPDPAEPGVHRVARGFVEDLTDR